MIVAEDHSLSAREYQKRGLPDPSKPWTAKDLATAAKVLQSLSAKDRTLLPRRGSPTSGAVFARLCAVENFAPLKDRSLSLEQRGDLIGEYMPPVKQLMLLYANLGKPLPVFDAEAVDLGGLMLRLGLMVTENLDEILPTISPKDPLYATRMKGVAQVRQGMAEIVSASLMMLTEKQTHRTSERLRLMDYLKETAPKLLPRLPKQDRSAILLRLQQTEAAETNPQLKTALHELSEQLSPSAEQPDLPMPAPEGVDPSRDMKMNRVEAGTPDETGWCRAESSEGKFAISLPGKFNDMTITAPTKTGKKVHVHVIGMNTEDGVRYRAVAMEAAEDSKLSEKSLSEMVEPFRKDGKLREQRSLQWKGNPGLEVHVTAGNSSAVMRYYAVGQVLYQVSIEYPSALEDKVKPDVKKCMESFTIKEK